MKKLVLALLLLNSVVYAQICKERVHAIAEQEAFANAGKLATLINPNTQNYDVTYHKLEFTVDPAVNAITGKVTTTFTALADMNSVTFELSNQLTVSSTKENGTALSFVQNSSNELVINFTTTHASGGSYSVEIEYSGTPVGGGFGSFIQSTHNGSPVIWTLSEPFGALDWWPCKQDLNDKVNSIDVYITAPSQYVSVSNGVEPQAPVISGSNKITHFHHGYPIPAYLVAIAVTNYDVYTQTAGTAPNTYPIINYLYPESNTLTIQNQLAQTPLLIDLYSNLFEIYPFHNEKYGHAQFGWGGGMEHTTVSFMVGFDRQLVAHELAHQWFGDKITCGTWKDIWLNEGFATYCASLAYENFDGVNAFISDKADMVSYITSQPYGNVYLNDTQALDVNRIFNSRVTYNKGAMVLEMLRWKLGDTAFFQGMKNYLADTNLAYNYAVTSQFQAHMEAVYGSSLTEFFNDWIYKQGFPSYTITAQNIGTNQYQFTVNQTQSHSSVSFFEMPIPVRAYDSLGNSFDITLNNTTNGQVFSETLPFEMTSFDIDPDVHLISNNNTAILTSAGFIHENAVSIFPNPVNDVLTVKIPSSASLISIDIINQLGQIVGKFSKETIDIANLSSGNYIAKINTTQGSIHKKIIKN